MEHLTRSGTLNASSGLLINPEEDFFVEESLLRIKISILGYEHERWKDHNLQRQNESKPKIRIGLGYLFI